MADPLTVAAERFSEECDRIIMDNHEGRTHLEEPKATFEGGATRSVKLERYDLIPPEANAANARRFGLGVAKHGEENWKNGGAAFIRQCINHALAHLNSLLANGPFHSDDDIGAALTNTSMLAWFREHKPDEFRMALRAAEKHDAAYKG